MVVDYEDVRAGNLGVTKVTNNLIAWINNNKMIWIAKIGTRALSGV